MEKCLCNTCNNPCSGLGRCDICKAPLCYWCSSALGDVEYCHEHAPTEAVPLPEMARRYILRIMGKEAH